VTGNSGIYGNVPSSLKTREFKGLLWLTNIEQILVIRKHELNKVVYKMMIQTSFISVREDNLTFSCQRYLY